MPKKATKTTAVLPEEQAPIFVQLARSITSDGLSEDGHKVQAMHRSPMAHQHLKDPFTVADYDAQRPAEADPKSWEQIFKVCDSWYQKNGLIRNIIDLMSDFCVAGVQISSPDAMEQAVLRKWFKLVRGKHVSERIANMLYRVGNVGIRKQFGKVRTGLKEEWAKSVTALQRAEINIPEPKEDTGLVPYKYVTIPPKYIRVPTPEVTAFLDEPWYGLKITKDALNSMLMTDQDFVESDLISQLPEDIKEALSTGKAVRLDNSKFKMLHYKKDDFDKRFAYPLIYAALSDLFLYSKMQLADRNVVDSAIKRVVFVKVGDAKTGQIPEMEYLQEMGRMIAQAGAGGSESYIVTQPWLEIEADSGNLHSFLGKQKYEAILEAIYATFGVPAALTGTASGAAANNFMSMKVLVKKLEYVRDMLKEFWADELKHVCKSFGFDKPVFLTFTYQELGDESAIKKLIQDMYDRDVISDETYRYMMQIDHQLEELRLQDDMEKRKARSVSPKAGPFHSPMLDSDIKKMTVQQGTHPPEAWGVIPEGDPRAARLDMQNRHQITLLEKQGKIAWDAADHQSDLDIKYENAKPQPTTTTTETPTKKVTKKSVKKSAPPKKAVKKAPGQGRPKNSRDTNQRQRRTMKAPNKK
jgi:hypothetical protein